MSVTGTNLEELLSTLRTQRRRLPFEIGAFLALNVTEALLERPRRADPARIAIREDGTVEIVDAEACDERAALVALHRSLTGLLAAAGEGVPAMLLDLVEQSPESEALSLARFRDELEASLVPLNRAAAQRVLARTIRDIRREASSEARAAASTDDVDADLDALISGAELPVREAPVLIARPAEDARSSTRPPAGGEPKRSIFKDHDDVGLAGLEELPDSDAPKLGTIVAVAAIVLAVIGVLVLVTRERSGDGGARRPERASEHSAVAPPSPVERGEIALELEPEGSVARLFVGRLPTVVDDVPVGVSQELVALSEDGSFVRAVVPSNAAYRDVDGLPEFGLDLVGSSERGENALGTTALRAEGMGRSSGRSGRIRIGTGTEGARVYRTIGFSPLARLSAWPVERSAELLVSAPGHVTQRVLVRAADFHDDHGERRATVHVTLRPASAPAP